MEKRDVSLLFLTEAINHQRREMAGMRGSVTRGASSRLEKLTATLALVSLFIALVWFSTYAPTVSIRAKTDRMSENGHLVVLTMAISAAKLRAGDEVQLVAHRGATQLSFTSRVAAIVKTESSPVQIELVSPELTQAELLKNPTNMEVTIRFTSRSDEFIRALYASLFGE